MPECPNCNKQVSRGAHTCIKHDQSLTADQLMEMCDLLRIDQEKRDTERRESIAKLRLIGYPIKVDETLRPGGVGVIVAPDVWHTLEEIQRRDAE